MKLWRAFYYILNSFLFDEMVTSECFRDKEGENEAGFSGDLEKFEIEKVMIKTNFSENYYKITHANYHSRNEWLYKRLIQVLDFHLLKE